MAKSDDQKLKILYIRDYLERCSHENHPVSTAELLVFLDSKGISCILHGYSGFTDLDKFLAAEQTG